MLEKIKHLFSVPNINFLLVINKTQLQESIRSTYGLNIDSHAYLQKFINIEATLPKRTGRNNDVEKYCKHLSSLYKLKDSDWADCFTALGTQLNCSLRELERIYSNLAIMLLTEREDAQLNSPLISAICVFKVMRPALFSRLSDEDLTIDDFYEALKHKPNPKSEKYTLDHIIEWLHICLMPEAEFASLDHNDELRRKARYFQQRNKVIGILAQKLNSFSVG